MVLSEKSIFTIIIGLLFHIRPLPANTSISEMTRSLSVRTFPLKNKYRRLKLGGKKILHHLGNLIYIIWNLGPVAQRLEQWTHNPLVVGSNPTGPSCLSSQPQSTYAWQFFCCILKSGDFGRNSSKSSSMSYGANIIFP